MLAPPHGAGDCPSIAGVAPSAGGAFGGHAPLTKLFLLRVATALSLSHPNVTNERHLCLLKSSLREPLLRVVLTNHCTPVCAINSQFVNETKEVSKTCSNYLICQKHVSASVRAVLQQTNQGRSKRGVFYIPISFFRIILGPTSTCTCSTAENHTMTLSNRGDALKPRASTLA